MSIAELKALVPPPAKPFELGTLAQWRKGEELLGVKLPKDYREFVYAYGSGLFAEFYLVYNPFAADEYLDLLRAYPRVCDACRQMQRSFPERYPYSYYPDAGGLLPWGGDENGNYYFWLTEGPPSKWVVVQDNVRGDGLRVQPYSLTGFLAAVLRREVKALASGYPRKRSLKFEPMDPSEG